jgi:glutathione synthase/RimK-type ligase-like ATP-grasp enzyme
MRRTSRLDVLIVYIHPTAHSAGDSAYTENSPFSLDSEFSDYNAAYAYFLEECQAFGMTAGFAVSADVVGAGLCHTYWTYDEYGWQRHMENVSSHKIFDKFSPSNARDSKLWKMLFSSLRVIPFNEPRLTKILSDKLLTYTTLSTYTIPTVTIGLHDTSSLKSRISELRALVANHTSSHDFDTGIIMKDRFGSAGNLIYRITHNYAAQIATILKKHPRSKFILQPFLLFDKGFLYKNIALPTDIRLIYHNGHVIQTYLRRAGAGDFRCNSHQGGTATYIDASILPQRVLRTAEIINRTLGYSQAMFTLDFAISNTKVPYLLEGNIRPGLYWDKTSSQEERMSKILIDSIVTQIAGDIHSSHRSLVGRPITPLYI